jgi:hypothetical protein
VRNDRRYTTSRGDRQGRGLKERNSVWDLKKTGVVGSLEMPLSSCFPQNPMVNGGLAHRTREIVSSAFQVIRIADQMDLGFVAPVAPVAKALLQQLLEPI